MKNTFLCIVEIIGLVCCLQLRVEASAVKVLFIGNSFTHGHAPPVMTYRPDSVTDLDGTRYGGVPAIFKELTEQAGLDYQVSSELVSGQPLSHHVEHKSEVIKSSAWDIVVLQGLSTEPLPPDHGGNPTSYLSNAAKLKQMVVDKNPDACVYMYETWSAPAALANHNYPASEAGLRSMQDDLRAPAFLACADNQMSGVVRVGDAMMLALDRKIGSHIALGDTNNSQPAGSVDLWDSGDHRHANKYGSYLSAALMFAKVTKGDPRLLKAGPGTAAADLEISDSIATRLHELAYEVSVLPDPSINPSKSKVSDSRAISEASFSGKVSQDKPPVISGDAEITSITTAEGTFADLVGSAAIGIKSTNKLSALGTEPADVNQAVTGLSANDGANNLGEGIFQFRKPFDSQTRFFIVESAPENGAVGDDTRVQLVDAQNNRVGDYELRIQAADFVVASAAKSPLALLSYSSGVEALTKNVHSKLGGTTFSLADLGLKDSEVVGKATGLRLVSATLDPNIVGLFHVAKEPASAPATH